jgi:succinate dehydrogenase / fumarate reductase iron-sulfur subunit
MNITVKIKRFDPDRDAAPYWKSYTVDADPMDRALDLLMTIKWHQDGTLTFRKSCAHGICGSDAMKINGENKLACGILVQDLGLSEGGTITFEPLPAAPVIKDLVVDQTRFFDKYRAVMPWLINDGPTPEKERYQSPEDHAIIEDATKCILCGACTHSCPSTWADPDYLGPAAMLKAYRYVFDSRDTAPEDRLEVVDSKDGLWKCYTIFNCVQSCPKEIDITRWLSALKRKSVTARY